MAYADFLTALMAFFLMLWLVTGVSQADRAEIAAEFTGKAPPPAASLAVDQEGVARLFAALTQDSALAAAGSSVTLTREPDAVRLDLIDSEARPLFHTGDGSLTGYGRSLVATAGAALTRLPHAVSIEGHTDAFLLSGADGESNWELSADRAGDARRTLVAAGLDPRRIRAVTGLADTVPLDPGQPHAPANRRISLRVHTGS